MAPKRRQPPTPEEQLAAAQRMQMQAEALRVEALRQQEEEARQREAEEARQREVEEVRQRKAEEARQRKAEEARKLSAEGARRTKGATERAQLKEIAEQQKRAALRAAEARRAGAVALDSDAEDKEEYKEGPETPPAHTRLSKGKGRARQIQSEEEEEEGEDFAVQAGRRRASERERATVVAGSPTRKQASGGAVGSQ